jgi:hypothetical protein
MITAADRDVGEITSPSRNRPAERRREPRDGNNVGPTPADDEVDRGHHELERDFDSHGALERLLPFFGEHIDEIHPAARAYLPALRIGDHRV